MSWFDDALDIIAEFKMAAKQCDHDLVNVGDETTVDIPDATSLNALLLKGKNGRRYRIDGLHLTREK